MQITNKFTFFDTETTGLNIKKDRLVSVFCENKHKNWKMNVLTNPEIEISIGATKVHGIDNKVVKDKPFNKEVLKVLVKIFNDTKIICGYNIFKFDIPLVINLCKTENINIDYKNYKYIDVFLLLKYVLDDEERQDIGPLTLSNVYKYITKKELTNAHDAAADCYATKVVLDWIIDNYHVDDCLYLSHQYIKGENVDLDYIFFTGKKKDYTLKEVLETDVNYVKWMVSQGHLVLNPLINIKEYEQ
jgi:DNA polymerase III epsilon subunit-like protein